MNGIDRKKYVSSILAVFVFGALLNLAIEQGLWHQFTSFHTFLRAMKELRSNATGLFQLWTFVASGGTLAGLYVWLFESYLWKIPALQGRLILFPNLEGTWVGVLRPRTKSMQLHGPTGSERAQTQDQDLQMMSSDRLIPDWAIHERVLPVHVTIEHEFDRLTFTAIHPNSTNTTLANQMVYIERSKETQLYIVYANEPKDDWQRNAVPHKGCCELRLINKGRTKSATTEWSLSGIYWTNKIRNKEDEYDRGTWGNFDVRWESRKVGESNVDFNKARRFTGDK